MLKKKNSSKSKTNLITISVQGERMLCIDVNWKRFYKLERKTWDMLKHEIVPWLYFKYMEKKYEKRNGKKEDEQVHRPS